MRNLSPALIFVVAFTAITSLMIGYDLCIVSSVLKPISTDFDLCGASRGDPRSSNLSCFQKSFFVSMLSPGAALGSIVAGIFSDIFGRRRGLMLGDVLIAAGSVCFALGHTYGILLLGRFIIGIGIGVGFVVFAIYIPEVAPAQQRGGLVTTQDCALSVGCLISYAVIALVPATYWRVLLGSVGIVAALQFLGCFLLPESPRWLVRRHRSEDAVASVLRLLPKSSPATPTESGLASSNPGTTSDSATAGVPSLHEECTATSLAETAVRRMVDEYHEEQNLRRHATKKRQPAANRPEGLEDKELSSTTSFHEHYVSRVKFKLAQCWDYRSRLGIAIGCAVAQNFTVSNSVLYFSLDILNEAGIHDQLLAGVGVGLVKFLGVLCAIFLVDRLGRRCLLLWGSITTCVCLFLFSAFFAAKNWGNFQSSWVALPLMFIYIYGWNISWAGLMFVVASEVLPSTVRGIGMGLTITVFWFLSFVFQSVLEPTMAALTMQGAFFFFGCLNVLPIFFVLYCIRDLTGVALEDVKLVLDARPKAATVVTVAQELPPARQKSQT